MVTVLKKLALLVLFLVFFLPLYSQAEIKEGSFELSPFAGFHFFESKQNLKDRPIIGGRLGYNITNRFAVEGTVKYTETRVDDKAQIQNRKGQFTSPIDNVRITMYHLDLLYHFMPEKNFNPFIVAGYGAARYSPKINNKNMSMISYGIGAKYWVSEKIALRIDLRDNLAWDETIHNFTATTGIIFRFGGKSKPESTPVVKYVPEPTPVVEIVPEVEPAIKITRFEDIYFDFNESTLNPEAQEALKRNIEILKENADSKIRIAGHTSAIGSDDYNQQLSEKRAAAVKTYLINEGAISPDRFVTVGYGSRYPLKPEEAPDEIDSPAAKANMRVIMKIIEEIPEP